jgi:hypothetical protein
MSERHLLPALCVAAALAALAPATRAQAPVPKKQGSFGTGKSGGPLLTRDELRACFALQDRIRADSDAAARERDALEQEKAAIVREGDTLKERLATLDRTSQEAVDRYNAEAAARDRRIDALEARLPAFNQKVEALAADRATWGRSCENRRYDEVDELQIQRGK